MGDDILGGIILGEGCVNTVNKAVDQPCLTNVNDKAGVVSKVGGAIDRSVVSCVAEDRPSGGGGIGDVTFRSAFVSFFFFAICEISRIFC